MLTSIKLLYGDKLGASDGEIGHVKDFYFDDQSWAIRYLVVDTGSWLSGRQVLLTPHSLGRLDESGKVLRVNLARQQIEESPSIELHKPVSRQYEEEYYRYYGWPCYWQGDGLWGLSGFPILEHPAKPLPNGSGAANSSHAEPADAHLRSTQAVSGYHFKTLDGEIGHVCDFMIDDVSWAIRRLVVKTGHRLSGTEVEVPTSMIDRISYEESSIFANLTGEAIKQSPRRDLPPVAAAH